MGLQARYGVSAPDAGWYRRSVAITASANAQQNTLFEVDLVSAAGNVVITLPASATLPYYVGAVNRSILANGSKVVIIQTSAAVEVCRLSAAGESVWVARNLSGSWEILAHSNPSEYQWTWANATERLATQASAAQIGRIGYQTDMAAGYQLLAASSWGQMFDPTLSLSGQKWTSAQANSATINSVGMATAVTGTLTARNPVGGATKSQTLIRAAVNTTAVAANAAGYRGNQMNMVPLCGYRLIIRGTLGAVSASMKWACGAITSAPTTNVDLTTMINCIFIARNASEANAQLMHNNNAGAVTQVDLGAAFPAATVDTGYAFQLYTANGGSYTYGVRNLDTQAEVSGILTTNIPVSSGSMAWFTYSSNNLDAQIVSFDFADVYYAQITR